jgi:hypothetical protein
MLHVPAGTQAAPHVTLPAGQLHTPLAQTLPPGQMLPQAPQFVWSASRLAHAPLGHAVRLHVAEHVLFEQNGAVAGQMLPQAPQFSWSEAEFMQLVPHL